MTLLSAWALAGLLLTVPLVLLHLRRRQPPSREVSSLLPWRELATDAPSPSWRLGRPVLPLLLLLQLLALVLLVLSLARPASGLGTPRSGRIYVVDGSFWMQHREARGERMALARQQLNASLRALPGDTHIQLVLAGPTPSLLYSGPADGAGSAIARLRAGAGAADLSAALRLAGGLRRAPAEPIALLGAPEDPVPAVRARAGTFRAQAIGAPFAYQGLSDPVARCELPGTPPCEAFARVDNETATAQNDRVVVLENGRPLSYQPIKVPAGHSAAVAFHTPPGRALALRLEGADAFAPVAAAYVAVPAVRHVTVTLVGNPAYALPLAQALKADPEVELHLLRPSAYSENDARRSQLLVLDRWLPPGGLPPAAALLLVAPPRLPGGKVTGTLADSRLSGSDPTSVLLADVDLTSLTIYARAAQRLILPDWMQAAAWSPEGPLLASGSRDGQQVAVLAVDPSGSNLPQLASFPLLMSDLVAWSQEFVPDQGAAGEAAHVEQPPGTTATTVTTTAGGSAARGLTNSVLEVAQPGIYTLTQRGVWGERSQAIAVNAPSAAQLTPPPPSSSPARHRPAPPRTPLWPWVLGAALLVLILEWTYATQRRVRAVLT